MEPEMKPGRNEVEQPAITTTLLSLIDAVSEELGEANQALVTEAVVQLLRSGHVRMQVEGHELLLGIAPRPWRRAG
ncbi:MAG: hypothetical protein U1E76_17155 [Planctomycetota bacterium]